jgi:putative holliday junction resolvase
MRFLGIDYGSKRIGLAGGDELGIATPLPAVLSSDPDAQDAAIGDAIRTRRIDELVIGLPLNMDGSHGPSAQAAEAFAARLKARFGLPVHFVDERLTSSIAEQGIAPKDRRTVRDSGLVDSRAAALILQDYLDQRFPPPLPEGPE